MIIQIFFESLFVTNSFHFHVGMNTSKKGHTVCFKIIIRWNKKNKAHTKSRLISFRASRSRGKGELYPCIHYDVLKFKHFSEFINLILIAR